MCKLAGLLIGWDYVAKRALVTRANCDSWHCPECSRRMAERWVLRAQIGVRQFLADGSMVDFITITSHEKLTSFQATQAVWRSAWPILYAAIKRRNHDLEYFIVPERHKDGRMHIHALWTAGVSQKWLKDNGRKRGLGYQAKVKKVADGGQAIKYVTKYVGKGLGEDVPKRTRRVIVSQGWPDIPAPNTPLNGLKWEYISGNGVLAVIMHECQSKNIDMIDLETGEFFDAPDLGTEVAPDVLDL